MTATKVRSDREDWESLPSWLMLGDGVVTRWLSSFFSRVFGEM